MESVNRVDNKGMTPLMYATQLDRVEIFSFLLENGAETTPRNQEGMSALQIAALLGSFHCLKIILDQNPPSQILEQKREDGKNLLHLVVLSRKLECVKALPLNKTWLTEKDKRGMTPAHYAAATGNYDIFAYLVNQGFPIDFQDNPKGETPLMVAIRSHQFPLADKMIQQGASLQVVNKKRLSPLHIAAGDGDCNQLVYLCRKKEIDVNLKNNRGMTALHLATMGGAYPCDSAACQDVTRKT